MTFEQTPIEQEEVVTSEKKASSENIADEIIKLKARINDVLDAKKRIEDIANWRDSVNTSDYVIVGRNQKLIESEIPEILIELNHQFDKLEKEIKEAGEVKSESGRLYQPNDIIKNIEYIRHDFNLSKETLPVLIKKITRTNDYRTRVSELLDLLVKVRSIKV